ncbi:MAG: type II toxin-antitoxin system Phd/YefM family antitoxin [Dethiobacter sp.]|jgi:PHD/YefM family antitoxin component YafN of YafNO toxin-antitoxin module|nr:type II toxin-antitoxin system Phd/YefM family antitoxin [Dethiobacter sp.]MBS3899837.1 type II toxin-antitoxin system Phd/YefM family antitoxin [Dethiobacter sp.]MBS3983040.1 type II toxin-antitoxin system Phd/YefM family antitoxin [Dethiobacter sp.]MCL5992604.1 type II toxin-antitoxin system Phd/YefM family antitoxin [Bacillota bacterium]
MNIDMDAMVSTTDISKSFGKYLAASKKNPVFILKNNEIESVLLDIGTYKKMVEAYELVQDNVLAREVFEQPTINPNDQDVFDIIREVGAVDNAGKT